MMDLGESSMDLTMREVFGVDVHNGAFHGVGTLKKDSVATLGFEAGDIVDVYENIGDPDTYRIEKKEVGFASVEDVVLNGEEDQATPTSSMADTVAEDPEYKRVGDIVAVVGNKLKDDGDDACLRHHNIPLGSAARIAFIDYHSKELPYHLEPVEGGSFSNGTTDTWVHFEDVKLLAESDEPVSAIPTEQETIAYVISKYEKSHGKFASNAEAHKSNLFLKVGTKVKVVRNTKEESGEERPHMIPLGSIGTIRRVDPNDFSGLVYELYNIRDTRGNTVDTSCTWTTVDDVTVVEGEEATNE